MGNGLLLREVEIVVGLDAATVGVRRHRVPRSTWVELGQTKLELAGAFLQYVVDDELIDGAVVALLQRTDRSPDCSLQRALTTVEGDPLGLIVLVGGGRVQVELSRLRGILRAEEHLLVNILVLADVATTNVQRLLGRECILLAIDDDNTVALATVDNTYLTVVEEILLLDVLIDIETQLPKVLQFQGLVHWHSTAKDETVVVAVGQQDRVCGHHLLHHETLTKGLRVVAFHILRMAGGLETNMLGTNEAVGFLCVDRNECHCQEG